MSEQLDYIKEISMEIANLNHIIQEKDEEILKLTKALERAKSDATKNKQIVDNITNLYNEVYHKYADVKAAKKQYEKRFIAVSEVLMSLWPQLGKKVDEDINDDIFSDILHEIRKVEDRWD